MQRKQINATYVNCLSKSKFGDYTAAALLTDALATEYRRQNIPVKWYFVSAPAGVKILKNLYGNGNDNQLNIHNHSFKVMTFANYLQRLASFTLNYLVVGCAVNTPSEINALANIAPRIQVSVALLPHMGDLYESHYRDKYSLFKLNFIRLGLGKDRIGVSVTLEPEQPIQHAQYYRITAGRYALAYFNTVGKPLEFLMDFFRVNSNSNLANPVKHFVVIGDCSYSLSAAIKFISTINKAALIFDVSKNEICIVYHDSDNHCTWLCMDADQHNTAFFNSTLERLNITIDLQFVLKKGVSNREMQNLMRHATPLVAVPGVSSSVEALALGKILFIQYLPVNHLFYLHYVNRIAESVTDIKKLVSLLQLTIWREKLSDDQINNILVPHLNDDSFMSLLSTLNQSLLESPEKFAAKACEGFNLLDNSDNQPVIPRAAL